jgi:hypothetical protein
MSTRPVICVSQGLKRHIYAPSDHQVYLPTHLSIWTKELVSQFDHYTLVGIQDTQMLVAVAVAVAVDTDPHILHTHDYYSYWVE